MSVFFRQFQHLLPRGRAWRITVQKTLRSFFEGLSDEPADVREYIDEIWDDIFPDTTRELEEWEKQFGLNPGPFLNESNRRLALAAAWAAQGGQDPSYIQGIVQAAGFDTVFVHDWWVTPVVGPAPVYVPRDPRNYTTQPLVGSVQCSAFPSQPQCSALASQPQCNRFLVNDPGYLVNKDLTRRAPPPIPDDPVHWPHFVYFGGETFGEYAEVPAVRKNELEALVLKLCPTEKWIVMNIDYTGAGIFDFTFDESFE